MAALTDNPATFASLSAIFTDAFAEATLNLNPEVAPLMKRAPFQTGEKMLGNIFHQPVILGDSWGLTFNSDGSAFDHSEVGSVVAQYADAQIQGTEILMEEKISLKAAAAARGGVKQFENVAKMRVKMVERGLSRALETSALYGRYGLGETTEVTASGTSGTLVFSAASWSAGLWNGTVGQRLDVYATRGSAAKTNTTAAIIVTGVTPSTRTVAFSCNAGDVAALDALTTSVVFRRNTKTGATTYNEPLGLIAHLSTGSGSTVHNISTNNSLWLSQSFDVGSTALNLHKLQAGLADCRSAGLDGPTLLVCSPKTWVDMQAELVAGRYLDGSYKSEKVENGVKTIGFWTQTGEVEVLPHPMMWDGKAIAFPTSKFVRIGSTDVTLKLPGTEGKDMLYMLQNHAGFGIKGYTDQAPFLFAPAQAIIFNNIVNTVV